MSEFLNKHLLPSNKTSDPKESYPISTLISMSILTAVLNQYTLYFDYDSLIAYSTFFESGFHRFSIFKVIFCISYGLSSIISLLVLRDVQIWKFYSLMSTILIVSEIITIFTGNTSFFLFSIFKGIVTGITSGSTSVMPILTLWYNVRTPGFKPYYAGIYFFFSTTLNRVLYSYILRKIWYKDDCLLSNNIKLAET